MPDPQYPLVRLVSAPSSDATTRFDFNDGLTWAEHDGFDLGTPAMLGDPGGVGSEYDYRALAFRVNVEAGEFDALAKQTELARALMRDDNYLMFQVTPTAPPMWFRCVRSSPGGLSLADVYRDRDTNRWGIAVSLVAEPFALGEQVSHTLTIGNDPATGGLSTTLPPIKGDAPAPLVVEIDAGSTDYLRPWLSVTGLDGTWPGLQWWQAEALTPGPSAAVVAGAALSGGSGVQRTVPVGSWGAARLVTGSAVLPFAGRWRLFARLGVSVLSSGATASFTATGAGDSVSDAASTTFDVALTSTRGVVADLGIFAFPKGNMPAAKPYTLATCEFGVDVAANVSGAVAFVTADYIVAVPLDLPLDAVQTTSLDFRNPTQTSGTATLRLDGETGSVTEIAAGALGVASPEIPAGDFLRAAPGATNILHVLPRRGVVTSSGTTSSDNLTDSTVLDVSYRPRYLYLPGY